MTRTTTHSIDITCPDWCVEDPAHHAAELWNVGNCIHRMEATVEDRTGYHEALAEPRFHDAVLVDLDSVTSPENRENTTPTVRLTHGAEMSVQQAEDLAKTLRKMIKRYRESGGVA